MTQKEFYLSPMWRKTRKAFISHRISIDGGICQVCKDRPGKIVHHKEWLDDVKCNIPEIALSFSNLRYECQDCHNQEVDPKAQKNRYCSFTYGRNGEIIKKE